MHVTVLALLLALAAPGCSKSTSSSGHSSPKQGVVGADLSVIDGDLKQMQGDWKLILLGRGKTKFTYGKETTNNILTVTGDKMNRRWFGRSGVMQAKLDSTKTPKTIDLVFLEPDGTVTKTYFTPPDGRVEVLEGRVFGIYELQGDNLKICFPDTMKTSRPTDFTLGPEADRTVMTLQRMK